MQIINIIITIILLMVSFISGAVWHNVKETKYAKKVNYNCEKCESIGCQAKWCKEMRKIKNV